MFYLQLNTPQHTAKMIVLPSFLETCIKAAIQVLRVFAFLKSASIYNRLI